MLNGNWHKNSSTNVGEIGMKKKKMYFALKCLYLLNKQQYHLRDYRVNDFCLSNELIMFFKLWYDMKCVFT